MAFETWGTFSVADHLAPRAFVADVLLYDRLVIPVPVGKERERWEELGREPEVLDTKLRILQEPGRKDPEKSLVVRLDWTEEYRWWLDNRYPKERARARLAYAKDAAGDLHHMFDRQILAREDLPEPTEDVIREVVPAYVSYEAMAAELKPRQATAKAPAEPDSRLAGVVGWEFFVPSDAGMSDDDLLAESVRLVQSKRFRKARADFHEWRKTAAELGATPEAARADLEQRLETYQKETARARVRTGTRYGFALVGGTAGLVAAVAIPPLGIAAAALTLVQLGVEIGFAYGGDLGTEGAPAAMFHDARKHFGWK